MNIHFKELENAIQYFHKVILNHVIETGKLTRYMQPLHQKEINAYLIR